jgi:hypothetical protein
LQAHLATHSPPAMGAMKNPSFGNIAMIALSLKRFFLFGYTAFMSGFSFQAIIAANLLLVFCDVVSFLFLLIDCNFPT